MLPVHDVGGLMRTRSAVLVCATLLSISGCGGGDSRMPAAPSTGIHLVPASGAPGPQSSAVTVSWSCFTNAGSIGTFGTGACASARQTTSRFLPAAGSPISAPGVPTNLSATVSGSVVTLNWSAPVGGDAPSSYLVQAGSSAGLTDITSFDTGSTATSLAVFNVPAGTY